VNDVISRPLGELAVGRQMEQLRPVELKLIDELFGMSSGYVLDFTNSTFPDFFRREDLSLPS
jgi:hypothetical protein